MESSASAESSAKVLSVLKELPIWLLFAIDLFLISLFVPELNRELPGSLRPWVPLAALLFTLLLIFRGLSRVFEYRKTQQLDRTNREKQRLNRVYEPIYALFLTRHVTLSSSIGAPYLRQRFDKVLTSLFRRRGNRVSILSALKAFFDKEEHTSGEVEWGGGFPLSQITNIVSNNSEYADQVILDLVANANRAQFEDSQGESILTDADLELFNHICSQYRRLKKKYGA